MNFEECVCLFLSFIFLSFFLQKRLLKNLHTRQKKCFLHHHHHLQRERCVISIEREGGTSGSIIDERSFSDRKSSGYY